MEILVHQGQDTLAVTPIQGLGDPPQGVDSGLGPSQGECWATYLGTETTPTQGTRGPTQGGGEAAATGALGGEITGGQEPGHSLPQVRVQAFLLEFRLEPGLHLALVVPEDGKQRCGMDIVLRRYRILYIPDI